MANRSRAIALSVNDLKDLERLVRAPSTPAGLSRRARAILLMSEGLSGVQVADKTGYTDVQVSRIRRRFAVSAYRTRLWFRATFPALHSRSH